jgi:methionyl-tRNA formyltransferase
MKYSIEYPEFKIWSFFEKVSLYFIFNKFTYYRLDRVCEVTNNYMQIAMIFLNDRTSASIETMKEDLSSLPRLDFIFNCFAPKKFPKWLLDLPKFDAANFHPGSNQYPGVGATSFALYNGDINFGLTAHRMDEGLITEK